MTRCALDGLFQGKSQSKMDDEHIGLPPWLRKSQNVCCFITCYNLPEPVQYIYHKIFINPREIGVRWPPIWLWGTTCNMPLLNSCVVVVFSEVGILTLPSIQCSRGTISHKDVASTQVLKQLDFGIASCDKKKRTYCVFIREAIVCYSTGYLGTCPWLIAVLTNMMMEMNMWIYLDVDKANTGHILQMNHWNSM